MRLLPMVTVACGLAVLGAIVPVGETAQRLDVRREGARLWIRAESAAAVELLAAVSKETGIAFELDEDSAAGEVTLALEGVELEQAVRRLVDALPGGSAHSFAYAEDRPRRPRLIAVRVFGSRRLDRDEREAAPVVETTPAATDRLDRMIAAGLPRETAEKVIELNEHARSIDGAAPVSADELSPESRRRLPELIARGVPTDRAVRMLLLQERYHETLAEIRRARGEPR